MAHISIGKLPLTCMFDTRRLPRQASSSRAAIEGPSKMLRLLAAGGCPASTSHAGSGAKAPEGHAHRSEDGGGPVPFRPARPAGGGPGRGGVILGSTAGVGAGARAGTSGAASGGKAGEAAVTGAALAWSGPHRRPDSSRTGCGPRSRGFPSSWPLGTRLPAPTRISMPPAAQAPEGRSASLRDGPPAHPFFRRAPAV